jgi:hypothetical protein
MNTKEDNISETESVSSLKVRDGRCLLFWLHYILHARFLEFVPHLVFQTNSAASVHR